MFNPIDVWYRLEDIDKRTIEGKMATFFWRKLWLDVGKIALSAAYLGVVALSVAHLMPSEVAGLATMLASLYSGATPETIVFSTGLGGLSGLTLLLNIYGLGATTELLSRALKIAERHALRR